MERSGAEWGFVTRDEVGGGDWSECVGLVVERSGNVWEFVVVVGGVAGMDGGEWPVGTLCEVGGVYACWVEVVDVYEDPDIEVVVCVKFATGSEASWMERGGSLEGEGATYLSGEARVSKTGELAKVEGWMGEFGVLPFMGVDDVDFVGVDDVDFVGVRGEVERTSREKMLRVCGVCGVAVDVSV